MSHYLGDHRILMQTRHGPRLILDTRDIILTPILLLKEEWEPETSSALMGLLRPGQHFVDVGANVGYFACLAARIVLSAPGGKVTAFEADPEIYGLLYDNLALNWHFSGVELHNCAAYSRAAELTFHKRRKYQGNSSIGAAPEADIKALGDEQVTMKVKAVALDDVIRERIDLIKIDVEGAEPFVLEGMQRLLREQPEMRILIEWSPGQIAQTGRAPQDLLNALAPFSMHLIGATLSPVTAAELANIQHGMLLLAR